jgi:uncharacterized damage-inducible protein DinB
MGRCEGWAVVLHSVGATDPQLRDTLILEQRLGQPPAPATLAETLLQIPLHGTHHRAQLNSRLRVLDVAPRWWTTLPGSGSTSRRRCGANRDEIRADRVVGGA